MGSIVRTRASWAPSSKGRWFVDANASLPARVGLEYNAGWTGRQVRLRV